MVCMQCSKCGRSFGADSLQKHAKNCGRIFQGRKFEGAAHYVKNTPSQIFKLSALTGSRLGRSNRAAKNKAVKVSTSKRSSVEKIAERAKLPVKPVAVKPPVVSKRRNHDDDEGFDVSEFLWGENETPTNFQVVGLHPFDNPATPTTRKYILPKFSETPSTKPKTRYEAATEVIRSLQAVPAHKTSLPVRRYM